MSSTDRQSLISPLVLALVVLVALAFLAPVVAGTATLFFRDVGNFHWPAKLEQARAWRDGVLPFVDLWRAGGQPGLGNLNTTPLYPTNLLLLATSSVAGTLWAFNAHFWLHLAAAPLAAFGLLRRLGVSREGAWVGAAAYLGNGFVLGTLGFHNLVAAVALVPALCWAALGVASGGHAAAPAVLALLWTLLLLGGDPVSAALALVAAALCVLATRDRRCARGSAPGGTGFALLGILVGTLIAWPQLSELRRILDDSARGALGFSAEGMLRGSWHPLLALDALFPFALGPPAPGFWGARFHGGAQPLFFTFFPGVLVWILLPALAGTPSGTTLHRVRRGGLLLFGLGVLVALGAFNPALAALVRWSGWSGLRFPVKAWWWVALGLALLVGTAFDRLRGDRRARRRTMVAALVLAALHLALLVAAATGALSALYRGWVGGGSPDRAAAETVGAVTAGSAVALAVAALVLILGWLGQRYPTAEASPCRPGEGDRDAGPGDPGRSPVRQVAAAAAVLAVAHLAGQMLTLRPLYPTMPSGEWLVGAEILADLDPHATLLAHGSVGAGFGPAPRAAPKTLATAQRELLTAGAPAAGIVDGRRYLLNTSPEGLDSHLTGLFSQVLRSTDDPARVRLLASQGATHLVSERAVRVGEGVTLLTGAGAPAGQVRLYRLEGGRRLFATSSVRVAVTLRETVGLLLARDFDPSIMAVAAEPVPGLEGPDADPAEESRPSVRLERRDRHGVEVVVDSVRPALVVFDRAFLSGYRAFVDGRRTPTTIANGTRLAAAVPAGRHRLVVEYDRRSAAGSLRVAVAGVLALPLLVIFVRRSRRRAAGPRGPVG